MRVAIREDLEKQAKQMLATGELSEAHLDSFLRLTPEARADWYMGLVNTPAQRRRRLTDKFERLVDLGIITAPSDYKHETCLKDFTEKCGGNFKRFNEHFLDENYPHPSHIITPGEQFWVRIYKQVPGETTSEERLDFLRRRRALLVGAQGLALLLANVYHGGERLPRGYRHFSYDEEDRLFHDSLRHGRVPSVEEEKGGDSNLYLSWFSEKVNPHHTIILFTEPPPPE